MNLLWMNVMLDFIAEQFRAGKCEKFKLKIYVSSSIRTSNLRTTLKASPAALDHSATWLRYWSVFLTFTLSSYMN